MKPAYVDVNFDKKCEIDLRKRTVLDCCLTKVIWITEELAKSGVDNDR